MAAIGFKPPSFGTDVFESVRVVEGFGPAIEGAVYANMAMPGWFAKEYIAKVGNQDQMKFPNLGWITFRWVPMPGCICPAGRRLFTYQT